jgi:hypothetical protein
MNKSSLFMALSPRDRAFVAIAVLLDGGDAPEYVAIDEARGPQLRAAAEELLALDLDVRLPYAGTMLRFALGEGA